MFQAVWPDGSWAMYGSGALAGSLEIQGAWWVAQGEPWQVTPTGPLVDLTDPTPGEVYRWLVDTFGDPETVLGDVPALPWWPLPEGAVG